MSLHPNSVSSYHEMVDSGKLSKCLLEVYKIISERGPITANEVAQFFENRDGHPGLARQAHGRIKMLKDRGSVVQVGTKTNPITGKSNSVYQVTGKVLPVRKKKTPRNFWLLEYDEGIIGFANKQEAIDHLQYYDGKIIPVKQILKKLKR